MIKTKVDVVSGFLGAGKTTFIKKLLADVIKGEKVVLIENEFGEIAVDGGFLKDAGVEIKEMSQGCICCSLVGDFAKSLKEILVDYTPDRIIIEPSGVGKLSDVLKAIGDVESELNVENNSAVTVVDARKCKLYHKNFGEFFNNQIQFASTVILSRTDLADQKTIDEATEVIRELNPTATIITTQLDLLSPDKLMEILESPVDLKTEMLAELHDEHEHHHHHHEHHHHHHDEEECDDPECECHHHHDDDDDDEDEHEHHHHEHHHHHHGEEECDDPECECHHHHEHGHHHADEVFDSIGFETSRSFTVDGIKDALEKLDGGDYGMILRAKGIVAGEDGNWIHFDFVPGEADVRTGGADVTGKLCVIGSGVDKDKIKELFGI